MKPLTQEESKSVLTIAVLAFFVGVFMAMLVFGGILGPLGLLVGFALVVGTVVLCARLFVRLWRAR